MDSPALEMVFHFQTDFPRNTKWSLRKIQNCSCKQIDQQLGISKFRKVFDCPHRSLVEMNPSEGLIEDEIISINVTINPTLNGQNLINYLFEFEDFLFFLEFNLEIVDFDPFLCILRDDLFPTSISDNDPPVQPILVFNPYFNKILLKLECVSPFIEIVKSEILLESRKVSCFLIKFRPNEINEYLVRFLS